jgi:predicted RNase H-like nuclease (RuvC/YqgF family)
MMVARQDSTIHRFEERIAMLEGELSRLASICRNIEQRLDNLDGEVANEQLYRRDCEYVFKTNGSGVEGKLENRKLGLSLLKMAADATIATDNSSMDRISTETQEKWP